jgi:hypothetical protein
MLRPCCAACKLSSWRRPALLMLMTRKEDHSVAGLPLLSTAGCHNSYTQSSRARAKAEVRLAVSARAAVEQVAECRFRGERRDQAGVGSILTGGADGR